jgi:hypothetical protein
MSGWELLAEIEDSDEELEGAMYNARCLQEEEMEIV